MATILNTLPSSKPTFSFSATDFGYKHYVPVLKSKQGELWALETLDGRRAEHVTPLIEIHREKNHSIASHAAKVLKALKKSWSGRPLFIDTQLFGTSGSVAVTNCQSIMSLAVAEGLNFVPVTSLSRSAAYHRVIAKFAQRGAMLRLDPADFTDVHELKAELTSVLGELAVAPEEVDVLIDYREVKDGNVLLQLIRAHVSSLPSLSKWRTLTIAGGSFPSKLADHQPHTWHSIERHEWTAWSTAVTKWPKLLRRPTFGDYGVRDTQPPSDFGSPSPNIRYTSNGAILMRRHDVLVRKGGSDGIHAICASLRTKAEFRGQTFTAGDEKIYVTATAVLSPGNAGNWTAWGMSHHFGAVVDEILNLRDS